MYNHTQRQLTQSRVIAIALLIATMLLVIISAAPPPRTAAQTGGGYDLTWSTIDGGGYAFSIGGGYSLGGTTGQTDAGKLSGGSYTLNGGFWIDIGGYRLYVPLILK